MTPRVWLDLLVVLTLRNEELGGIEVAEVTEKGSAVGSEEVGACGRW